MKIEKMTKNQMESIRLRWTEKNWRCETKLQMQSCIWNAGEQLQLPVPVRVTFVAILVLSSTHHIANDGRCNRAVQSSR